MKKLFVLMLSAVFISASAFANVPFARIPARVTDAFHARYTDATNVEWTHGLTNYKAKFNLGMESFSAKFDRHGRWLASDRMVTTDRMPRSVQNTLRKTRYGRWEIKSSYVEYKPDEQPRYHVLAVNGTNWEMMVFDRDGYWVNS